MPTSRAARSDEGRTDRRVVPWIAVSGDGDRDRIEQLASAAADSPSGLDELLAAISPIVDRQTARFFPNPLDAEEASQEVLLTVSRRIGSFDGRSKFTTWLHQVTTNTCIDWYRTLRRHVTSGEPPPVQASPGSSPSVLAGDKLDLLEAASSMDARIVEPVMMRDLLELEYREIAVLLDVPVGTVKSRIHEGRGELKRLLAAGRT